MHMALSLPHALPILRGNKGSLECTEQERRKPCCCAASINSLCKRALSLTTSNWQQITDLNLLVYTGAPQSIHMWPVVRGAWPIIATCTLLFGKTRPGKGRRKPQPNAARNSGAHCCQQFGVVNVLWRQKISLAITMLLNAKFKRSSVCFCFAMYWLARTIYLVRHVTDGVNSGATASVIGRWQEAVHGLHIDAIRRSCCRQTSTYATLFPYTVFTQM